MTSHRRRLHGAMGRSTTQSQALDPDKFLKQQN